MEITVDKLLATGKPTKIRNKEYGSTAYYVEPFLERMSKFTNDFRIQVRLPDQVTRTVSGDINMDDITYNRVWIQAVMPQEYSFDNHDEVIGMVYGLDVRKPVVKIYRGALNRACTNLCVFDPSFLNVQFIESGKPVSYKPVEYLMQQTSDMKLMLKQLKETEWEGSPINIEHNLGRWIRNAINYEYSTNYGNIKIGTDLVIKAYNSMFVKNDSPYYIGEGNNVNMFTVYNSFTQ